MTVEPYPQIIIIHQFVRVINDRHNLSLGLVSRFESRYNRALLAFDNDIPGDCSMPLTSAVKAKIVKTFQQSASDTGSSDVQIALLTARINALTDHLKQHKHDCHTRYGLTKMVSQRKRLMGYLKRTNLTRYQSLIKELEIRG